MRLRATSVCRRAGMLLAGALALAFAAPVAMAESPAKWARLMERPYQHLIERVAGRYQIDPHLFAALVEVESARRADAVSVKGARGLAQLMPGTAKRFGVEDPHDPEDNLEGAAQYLTFLIGRYKGDLALALAAYNAGEGAVDKYGDIPPFAETRDYVRRILARAGLKRNSPASGTAKIRVETDPGGRIVLTNVP